MTAPLGDTAFQTASGRVVNPAQLRAEDIHLPDICEHLAKEARFNGATPGVFYSVAQHSLLVGEIIRRTWREDDGYTRELCVLCGLLHDAPEAYLRDLATPVKAQAGAAYADMEHRAWLAIAEQFGLPNNLPSIVKRADLIALATEKRDLMPQATGTDWACLEGVKPWIGSVNRYTDWKVVSDWFLGEISYASREARIRTP